ncbi:hypothetical protein [Deinococcus hohokamensis]|uniref:Uncharacterized protein n=1 Tax=Deinococcus hohokamensis TaxID=309883 RepID=A0ABV9I5I6_9DEIO
MKRRPAPTEGNDGQNWKRGRAAELQQQARLDGQKRKRVITPALRTVQVGNRVYYVPPDMSRPYAGGRATVTRAPRLDVLNPSVRLKFADGTELTVPLRQINREGVPTETPAWLDDARRRPSWARLVRQFEAHGEAVVTQDLLDADLALPEYVPGKNQGRTQNPDRIKLLSEQLEQAQARDALAEPTARHRAQQILGVVTPKSLTRAQRGELLPLLVDAARADAVEHARRQARRGGRGPVAPEAARHQPVATEEQELGRLDQEQRAMVNNIAKCIHRRYFLSDKELRDLTDEDREAEKIQRTLGAFIRQAQMDTGLVPVKSSSGGRGSELHGHLHDSLAQAYPLALEACQMLVAGKDAHALTLALQVREKLLAHVAANTELARARRKHHTGRYFHGDVLSVREQHEDGSMTQFYVRLTILYGEDGHSLVVANAAELEALTGTRAGPQAWTSLCRWVEDHSERAGGRKQGRRQDDDEHLIYRSDRGSLPLRTGLSGYPNLIWAFECLRRALYVEHIRGGICQSEIPAQHPPPGQHRFSSGERKSLPPQSIQKLNE